MRSRGLISYILDTNSLYFNSLTPGDTTFIESYLWDFGNEYSYGTGNFDNPTETYFAQNGTTFTYYPTLTVTTNEGCSHTSFGNSISVYPTPIALITTPIERLGPGLYVFDGTQSITSDSLSANPDYFDYSWEIEDLLNYYDIITEFNPREDSTLYQYTSFPDPNGHDFWVYLTVTDGLCSHTDSIQQNVIYWKKLNVPNALAPNGGMPETDEFLPKGKSLKEYSLQIFDTWGNLVWQTSALNPLDGKPATAWKGTTLDNKPLQQGTYVWKIYAKFSDGSVWPGIDGKTTGSIYLIR